MQRYRAMACARQLYLFSSRIGQPGAGERAAALFRSLQHFHDAEHGGWFYNIVQGKPLDRRKDLYTHAFILFACAHYWAKVRSSLVESTLNAALGGVLVASSDEQFSTKPASMKAWSDLGSPGALQNPLMHLAEAFLAVLAVRDDGAMQTALLAP